MLAGSRAAEGGASTYDPVHKQSNSSYDWVAWHTDQISTAGTAELSACEGTNGENWKQLRKYDFDQAIYEVRDYGPTSTQNVNEVSVGLSIEASESGGSVGANWSWTYQVPDVTISTTLSPTNEDIQFSHLLTHNSTVAESTFKGMPGVLVRANNGRTQWTYEHVTDWVWWDLFWGTSNTYHTYGSGSWYTN